MGNLAQEQELTSIVMSEIDNVATLLQNIESGEIVQYVLNGQKEEVTAKQAIPFGHKIAIKSIQPTEHIVKYGQVIGAASIEITPGEHVHVHNIEGIRGRGDKAKGEQK
ncbi:UxaA family hydrolase [Bacillus sp. EB106-08-02-XG196]|jgi:altronate dehydratase small subunit|uniref:UxaA family hydrolase n=1 Tax=Bacillus sp. EB106-08-02-XG196 TaxID=2737049 RepID=UPI0015C46905|nr:UxaA family hydrolase [Bacillus sp. EB106-08-02-XG196]NWQ40724.1 UxaA family hydrolase [Bacillus sp. EB106-08-02-XG196]